MGRAHALSGAAVGLNAAVILGQPPTSAILLAAICGGAAVLPDIDHPDSTISRTLGPATWVLSRVVNLVSGGHRNGTHSALGCTLLALAAFAATALHAHDVNAFMPGLAASGIIAATALPVWLLAGPSQERCYKSKLGAPAATLFLLLLALTLGGLALAFGAIVGTVCLGLLLLLVLAALCRAMRIPGKWDEAVAVGVALWAVWPEPYRPEAWPAPDLTLVPWALTVGALVHCLGDAITHGKVPWAWPLTQKNVGPGLIETNGWTERVILTPLFVLAIGGGMTALLRNPWAGVVTVALVIWLLAETKTRPKRRRPTASRKSAARRKAPARKPTGGKRPVARKRPAKSR